MGNADVAGGLSTGLECHVTVNVTVNFSATAFKTQELPTRRFEDLIAKQTHQNLQISSVK